MGLIAAGIALSAVLTSESGQLVTESARELPLAYDVDVVVAGGSLAGVEAACAAADQGATVLLVESRPYLGYDLCAYQRLWIDTDAPPERRSRRSCSRTSGW